MNLGSLFDGSGGFPLAGLINGVTPVWASEIEPYPLKVTAARFPTMKQLGDVTRINGAEIQPVDIITFGSPCQDLSVAGAQKGIHDGERSSLFFEAIRIIREMRGVTDGKYPRFAVWENVPGAFGSNKGQDFRAVLEAFCQVCAPEVSVPESPKGKWQPAGCIVGDGYSIAWRVYDAQYWGVPQRRKRIYLVADFAGERAGEILFEREGMRRDSAPSREAREEATDDAEGSASGSGRVKCLNPWDVQSHRLFDVTGSYHSLYAAGSSGLQNNGVVYCLQGNGIDRADTAGCNGCGWRTGGAYTLNTIDRPAVVYDTRATAEMVAVYDTTQITCPNNYSNPKIGDPCHPLAAQQHPPLVVCAGNGQLNQISMRQQSNTLDCMHDQQMVLIAQERRYIVRRLTPLECCRLQGFPDWWEDGVEGSDSARYKMWGNGIALPCAVDVLRRIAEAGA